MKIIRFVTIVLCFAAPSAAAQTGSDAEGISTVLALENVWNRAEQTKDTKALDELLDDDLLYIDVDGSLLNKGEFLSTVSSGTRQPTNETTQNMTGLRLGVAIVVTGVYTVKGIESGKTYVRRGRFVDIWLFRNRKWKCVTAQATPFVR